MAHGGDIYSNDIEVDFSVSLNPLGAPESVIDALRDAALKAEHYPDPASRHLAGMLADRLSVLPGNIILGNGAAELIMAAAHAFSSCGKAIVAVPSFTGYEYALRAAGASVEFYEMKEEDGFSLTAEFLEHITDETGAVYLTNPNNPTGKYIEHGLLIEIIEKCARAGAVVILDECFMELSDAPESNSALSKIKKYPNLLILRSFTKTFAIPGLRLGYIVCADTEKLKQIRKHIPEWNISTLAQTAGEAALMQEEYLDGGRQIIKRERRFLENVLSQNGFSYIKSNANFILFKSDIDRELDLYDYLLKKKILIRDCSDFKGLGREWYRIAVRTHEENVKLTSWLSVI